jgi:hypothetical protein
MNADPCTGAVILGDDISLPEVWLTLHRSGVAWSKLVGLPNALPQQARITASDQALLRLLDTVPYRVGRPLRPPVARRRPRCWPGGGPKMRLWRRLRISGVSMYWNTRNPLPLQRALFQPICCRALPDSAMPSRGRAITLPYWPLSFTPNHT